MLIGKLEQTENLKNYLFFCCINIRAFIFRCIKCDFETNQEEEMKCHVTEHNKSVELKLILNEETVTQSPKEVFRYVLEFGL